MDTPPQRSKGECLHPANAIHSTHLYDKKTTLYQRFDLTRLRSCPTKQVAVNCPFQANWTFNKLCGIKVHYLSFINAIIAALLLVVTSELRVRAPKYQINSLCTAPQQVPYKGFKTHIAHIAVQQAFTLGFPFYTLPKIIHA